MKFYDVAKALYPKNDAIQNNIEVVADLALTRYNISIPEPSQDQYIIDLLNNKDVTEIRNNKMQLAADLLVIMSRMLDQHAKMPMNYIDQEHVIPVTFYHLDKED